jgi:HemK-like putative methylase
VKNQEYDWLLREKYHGEKSEAFLADCARMESGVPLAYIIGSIPFLDCTIYLDSHPLIPRTETEWWVEQAISVVRNTIQSTHSVAVTKSPQRKYSERGRASELLPSELHYQVLDLCAGSGAIGVAVAKAIPEAVVTFAEIDPNHLPTIQKNLTENTFIYESIKYPVIESDVFSNVTGTFDFILTNPPYIDAKANTVDASVIAHEPHLALFGGIGGMEIIARIITDARAYLTPQIGQLWIEHEPFQADAIMEIAQLHGFESVTYTDQYGTVRYSILTLPVAK